MITQAGSEQLALEGERRRDFLLLVAGATGGVALASALGPLIGSLSPSADVVAAGAPVDFDVSQLQPAHQKIVAWRGRPVFVLRRTADELRMLQEKRDTSLLRDPGSPSHQQPGYAKNWHRSIEPEYFVVVGIARIWAAFPGSKHRSAAALEPTGRAAISAPVTARNTISPGGSLLVCRRPSTCLCRLITSSTRP
jgi:ubiquinol-cytochrome c reductase iron-sulfur subunit